MTEQGRYFSFDNVEIFQKIGPEIISHLQSDPLQNKNKYLLNSLATVHCQGCDYHIHWLLCCCTIVALVTTSLLFYY